MKNFSIFLLYLVSLFTLSACNTNTEMNNNDIKENPVTVEQQFIPQYDWSIAKFDSENQDGAKVSLEDLKGEIWIMDMIFTNCETVCLPMTSNMAKLQKMAKKENVKVHFVSMSVDPIIDTPEKLKDYALQYEADFSNWDLLTGYTEEDIKRIAKSVKTLAEKPSGTNQITHSTKFFLVNKDGIAVKGYDGVNPPYQEIINDLKILN
jgi:protein SCO1